MSRLSDSFVESLGVGTINDNKKTGTDYTGDLSDPKYIASWFQDDVDELVEGGYAKNTKEAMDISEKNIRSVFEAAIKQGRRLAEKNIK